MSIVVRNKPVAMWNNNELTGYLDELVCTQGTPADLAIIAESIVRILSAFEPTTAVRDEIE